MVTPYGEAVRAAGVVGDVAADRARLLARRVGREVQAEWRQRRVRSRLSTPGSTQATRCVGVDSQDPVHLRGDDHDRRRRAAPRRRPGRCPSPAATNGRPWRARDPHTRLHLGGRQREAHDTGGAFHRRRVPAVEAELERPARTRSGASASRRSATSVAGESVRLDGSGLGRVRARWRIPSPCPTTSTSGCRSRTRRRPHVGVRRHLPH